MKLLFNKKVKKFKQMKGATLIEVMIFSFLLSFLLAGFMRFATKVHAEGLKLIDDIRDASGFVGNERGFIATTAVVVISAGLLAFAAAAMAAAASYSDSVYRYELRVQARLYLESCLDSVELVSERDYFLLGDLEIADLYCIAHVERIPAGSYSGSIRIKAETELNGIIWRGEREYTNKYLQ